MYLSSFFKIKFQRYAFNFKRNAPYGLPALIWRNTCGYIIVAWSFAPQIYNTIYTDFIPPARGVARRAEE